MYEIFEQLINSLGVTAYRVSKETGVSTSVLTQWKQGKMTPKFDKMKLIADYLGVTTEYLYGSDLQEMIINPDTVVSIPVLGICPCGTPIEAIENIVDYEEISASMAKKGPHFGLLAVGDSMFPSIMENDVLIVRQSSVVESGSIAIVKVNGDDATCKKIMIDEDGITLIPLNSIYDPIRYNNDEIKKLPITICGQVVEVRRKF